MKIYNNDNEVFDKEWVSVSNIDCGYLYDNSDLENDFIKLTKKESF